MVVAAVFTGGAGACDIDHSKLLSDEFPSEMTAVVTAAKLYAQRSAALDVEFVGAVYYADSGTYRVVVGRGCALDDGFRFRLPRIAGARPVALWHTHGAAGAARDLFSPADAATVRDTGLPFYLVTAAGGVLVLRDNEVWQRVRRDSGSSMRIRGGAFRGTIVAIPNE